MQSFNTIFVSLFHNDIVNHFRWFWILCNIFVYFFIYHFFQFYFLLALFYSCKFEQNIQMPHSFSLWHVVTTCWTLIFFSESRSGWPSMKLLHTLSSCLPIASRLTRFLTFAFQCLHLFQKSSCLAYGRISL